MSVSYAAASYSYQPNAAGAGCARPAAQRSLRALQIAPPRSTHTTVLLSLKTRAKSTAATSSSVSGLVMPFPLELAVKLGRRGSGWQACPSPAGAAGSSCAPAA